MNTPDIKKVTVGGQTFNVRFDTRAAMRLDSRSKDFSRGGAATKACILLWAMIRDEDPPEPEDLGVMLLDMEQDRIEEVVNFLRDEMDAYEPKTAKEKDVKKLESGPSSVSS